MDVRDLVGRYYEQLWNEWNDTMVHEVLSAGFMFRGSLGTETRGRDEWRRYRDTVSSGASDFHNEVVQLVIDGDEAAARLAYTGTHTGRLADLPPTGRRFAYAGAAFFVARDGVLGCGWVLGDLAGLGRQLSQRNR